MSLPSKYHNCKTVIDDIEFDSRKEGRRYQELKLMERAGDIQDLELQPRYDLIVNGHKVGFYKADFMKNFIRKEGCTDATSEEDQD